MSIAFDSASARQVWTTTPDPFVLSFTPIGTPAGILVLIHDANVENTAFITGVTYGGSAMTLVRATAGGTSTTWGYFLGTSVPTGTQNVSVDHTATAQGKRMIVYAITSTTGSTEVMDDDVVTSALLADPSVTLQTVSSDTFIGLVARIWNNDIANVDAGSGFTVVTENSEGASPNGTGMFHRGTSIFTGGDVVCQVSTTTADAVNVLAIAIRELGGGAATTMLDPMGMRGFFGG